MSHALKGTAFAVAILSAAGAGFEMIAGAGDAERYPMPGRLVDVGDHRLHVSCLGNGSLTVVLDAGLGGTSRDWTLVQSRLSARTRVCAYDRAGMGWSEAGPEPRSPAMIADELHRLLANAGIPGPYILVAHSLSGKSARIFATVHPDEVAGMVLVDTRSERIDAATTQVETAAFNAALARQATMLSLARRLGLVRLFGASVAGGSTLPRDVATELMMLQSQQQSLRATTQEGLARSANDAALTETSLREIPLVVIAAGDSIADIPGWAEAQAGLAALSGRGRLVVAGGSSHSVQVDQPEIVIDAVRSVLDAALAGQ
jgi:pimeloyl-ACP methyl ester carboxylesterase